MENNEEQILKINKQNKIIDEMTRTTSYIDWLKEFTMKYPIFSEDDWKYSEDSLSEEEKEKVENLFLFYQCIEKYAKRNYISATKETYGQSYLIKKDDDFFSIGYNIGEKTTFYCEKTEKRPGSISFYSIMNENLPMRTMYVDKKLETISQEIKELLILLEVPIEFIDNIVENTQKEAEKEKIYRKR